MDTKRKSRVLQLATKIMDLPPPLHSHAVLLIDAMAAGKISAADVDELISIQRTGVPFTVLDDWLRSKLAATKKEAGHG